MNAFTMNVKPLALSNENHDEQGRFASGGGGGKTEYGTDDKRSAAVDASMAKADKHMTAIQASKDAYARSSEAFKGKPHTDKHSLAGDMHAKAAKSFREAGDEKRAVEHDEHAD